MRAHILLRPRLLALSPSTPRPAAHSARLFATTRANLLKENKSQSPEEIEKAKRQQHSSEEKRKELESSSEEVVGAEQEKVKDHKKHMEELQKAGKQEAEGKR